MEKALLLIDDSREHVGVLTNITNYLKTNEGLVVDNFYLNPMDRPFCDSELNPNIDALIVGAVKKMEANMPALIIVDQYYGDASFNGLQVIERLRGIPKFKNCPVFLISGKRESIVREIFDGKEKDGDKVKSLSKIITLGISQFLDKTFRDEAINTLKKRDISVLLPKKLREYEPHDAKIQKLSAPFSKLTMSELADMMDSGAKETALLLDEMIELMLAFYVKIDANS
jgi:hypothetical protein